MAFKTFISRSLKIDFVSQDILFNQNVIAFYRTPYVTGLNSVTKFTKITLVFTDFRLEGQNLSQGLKKVAVFEEKSIPLWKKNVLRRFAKKKTEEKLALLAKIKFYKVKYISSLW